ncbi:hypothetical protein E2C01_067451 [Portunus trituberculatus]|uniref:Uncharacterized protein n=1 Tax=Portunus trituberculatus TaxID=210409 RepID=A0A5B7HSN3_PORTR|nr:hypothetical protein [Portunus trituberculatus]
MRKTTPPQRPSNRAKGTLRLSCELMGGSEGRAYRWQSGGRGGRTQGCVGGVVRVRRIACHPANAPKSASQPLLPYPLLSAGATQMKRATNAWISCT